MTDEDAVVDVVRLEGRACSLCGAVATLVAWADGVAIVGACARTDHLYELRRVLGRRRSFAHVAVLPGAAA